MRKNSDHSVAKNISSVNAQLKGDFGASSEMSENVMLAGYIRSQLHAGMKKQAGSKRNRRQAL